MRTAGGKALWTKRGKKEKKYSLLQWLTESFQQVGMHQRADVNALEVQREELHRAA
jgi:hypothetical protein